jgi:hypothetical protein
MLADNEQFYEEAVFPLIQAIRELCHARGMVMVVEIQYAPTKGAASCYCPAGETPAFGTALTWRATDAHENVDKLIAWLLRESDREPEIKSVYLQMIKNVIAAREGVPQRLHG